MTNVSLPLPYKSPTSISFLVLFTLCTQPCTLPICLLAYSMRYPQSPRERFNFWDG